MNGRCPQCEETHNVRISRGRYLCPIDGYIVTLGQTAVQLDRPMRLIWRPGEFGRWHITEPGQGDAQRLECGAGRILGTGCMVSDHYDPDRDRSEWWEKQAGLLLVDGDEPGDPAAWLVNDRLIYRQCAACASRIPDLPDHRVPTERTPSRAWATKGRSQYRRNQVPVDQGPHPAGTPACPACDPRPKSR
ncbi:hypothetical protein AB0D86_49335 [Streptomyces sp. NPDC048324]|uniref:hypothetical protein n=1 Tax=Streptomyces sp. NPDC048324 TaxID=3157205 RepID=UPI0034124304